MINLQKVGVSAGVVQNADDLYSDKQLAFRDALWRADHSVLGEFSHLGQPYKLSKTPARLRSPAPCIGEHNAQVCTDILKLTIEEFLEYDANGAFK